MTSQKITLLRCFTDGAAKKNSQTSSAGWGFYIPKLNIRKSGHMIGTNNQAELTAVKMLFEYLIHDLNNKIPVRVFTDSKYVIGCFSGNKKNANKVLIKEIDELAVQIRLDTKASISFQHVDAHTNGTDWLSKCNDVVDKLASDAANTKPEDVYKIVDKK